MYIWDNQLMKKFHELEHARMGILEDFGGMERGNNVFMLWYQKKEKTKEKMWNVEGKTHFFSLKDGLPGVRLQPTISKGFKENGAWRVSNCFANSELIVTSQSLREERRALLL